MDILITDKLLEILWISVTFSFIEMALVQKFKKLTCINSNCRVWIVNLLSSFLLGIPFAYCFYNLNIIDSIWVGIFGFVGAPSLYQTLKNQKLINYTPEALKNDISISQDNEIKRD